MQTIVGSQIPPSSEQLLAAGRTMHLTVEDDGPVHLQGIYSPQRNRPAKGLVLLLHGWLGDIDSSYMRNRGEYLYRCGYSVFRLNMRDHGGTEALNPGLFHGARLEEVFQAAHQIAALEPEMPFFIAGFSMGGNFALRIAWRHSDTPIPTLKKVVSVCPSADPVRVVEALDREILYRPDFRRKWRRQLLAKQKAYPDLYDFSAILALKTCSDMTDLIIPTYSDFPDAAAYYGVYACSPEKLAPINIPTAILVAADDPIIPVSSFQGLEKINPNISLTITDYGGHVGFIDLFPVQTWLNGAVLNLLEQ